MATVENGRQKVNGENAIFPTLLEQTIDVKKIELSGRRAGHSQQPDTVPVLFCSRRVHQFVLVCLRSGAEQTSDIVHLKDSKADFPACVPLRVEARNGYLRPSRIDVSKNLDDVFCGL